MVCSYCSAGGHSRTTCPHLCLVPAGQAKRGAAAQDRETPGHKANVYGTPERQSGNKVVHTKKGQSIAAKYRTGDVR